MIDQLTRQGRALRARIDTASSNAETVVNRFSESDGQFWPFGFLRPDPEERFSSLRVAALSILQGLPIGLFFVLVDGAVRKSDPQKLFVFLCAICLALFAANRATVAYFWNRRAERHAEQKKRLGAWLTGD